MSGKKRERSYLRKIIPFIINIIYPSHCKVCGKKLKDDENIICKNCISELDYELLRNQIFQIDDDSIHISVFSYERVVKDIIHLFKFNQYQPLGKIITEKGLNFTDIKLFQKYDFILPIPLTSKKKKSRGFNQTEIIAKIISEKTKIPIISIIKKVKETMPQSILSKSEREKNLKGVFSIIKRIETNDYKDKTILIIDDVLTTGSTFKEVKKTLRPLDLSTIDIFTLATTKNI
jgi:ComF family protein